jgi:hypothetical protein
MSYIDDLQAESNWHAESGRPGKPAIMRHHYGYRRGQADFRDGKTASPYLAGGEADRHWHAGFRAAQAEDMTSSGVGADQ